MFSPVWYIILIPYQVTMETETLSNKYQWKSWMKDQFCEIKRKNIHTKYSLQQKHPFNILIDTLFK